MAEVANVLLPIFAVIALGAVLRNARFAPPQVFHETNRLVYWIALPPYLFYKTAESQLEGGGAGRVLAALVAAMLLSIAVGYAVAWLMRLSPRSTSAFVQGAYRSNLAYVGLPIVLLAVANRGGEQAATLQAVAVISVAGLTSFYNVAAVLVLLGGREGVSGDMTARRRELGHRLRELLYRLVTNPLILSCGAGLVAAALHWKLPAPLRQTCATIGDMVTPLALIGIGASLTFTTFREHARNAIVAAALKAAGAPLLGLLVAGWFGISQPELRMTLLLLACPTAGASYVMAQQLGSDDGLAANIIVLSTVFALPALAVIIAFAR